MLVRFYLAAWYTKGSDNLGADIQKFLNDLQTSFGSMITSVANNPMVKGLTAAAKLVTDALGKEAAKEAKDVQTVRNQATTALKKGIAVDKIEPAEAKKYEMAHCNAGIVNWSADREKRQIAGPAIGPARTMTQNTHTTHVLQIQPGAIKIQRKLAST